MCFDADLLPALTGILSDNLWQFDDEAREKIEGVLVMVTSCCEWLVEECGLLTVAQMEQILDQNGLQRWWQLPPENVNGGSLQWPDDGQFSGNDCCDVATAIYDAIAEAYTQIYDIATAGADAFVGLAAPMLLVSTVASLVLLASALIVEGVMAALELAIATMRAETVCDMMSLCTTGTKEEQRAMRDFAMSRFAQWTPVPLGIVSSLILPVAKRLYQPGNDCECDSIIVGRPGGQTAVLYPHPTFTYQAGHAYRIEHLANECGHNTVTDRYRSIGIHGAPPLEYRQNFTRGGNTSSYNTCANVGGDGAFWSEFEVTTTTNLLRHADDPEDYEAYVAYFRVIDLGLY